MVNQWVCIFVHRYFLMSFRSTRSVTFHRTFVLDLLWPDSPTDVSFPFLPFVSSLNLNLSLLLRLRPLEILKFVGLSQDQL